MAGSQSELDRATLALYQAELDLVSSIAKRIFRAINGLVELDELLSAGREGLYQAAIRFEEAHGTQFRTFASYRIRGSIMDAVRKSSWLPRRMQGKIRTMQAAGEVAEGSIARVFMSIDGADRQLSEEGLEGHLASIATAMAIASSELPDAATVDDPEEACAKGELVGIVQEILPELNEVEANVIRLRYFENRDLESTAQALGIRKPWASRLESRALERLAKRLRRFADGLP